MSRLLSPADLRKWRIKRHLSQGELGELLGIHWTTISAWENGRTMIPPYMHYTIIGLEVELQKKKK